MNDHRLQPEHQRHAHQRRPGSPSPPHCASPAAWASRALGQRRSRARRCAAWASARNAASPSTAACIRLSCQTLCAKACRWRRRNERQRSGMRHCDMLIVGAGPAGLAAAVAAGAQRAASVGRHRRQPAPGGQIWRDGPGAALPPRARKCARGDGRPRQHPLYSGTRMLYSPAPRTAGRRRRARLEHAVRPTDSGCTGARERCCPSPAGRCLA
jgi:hypothetical protein